MGMPRTESQVEDYVYRLLPDYVRDDDDGTLATFLGKATASAMGPALRVADAGDPGTTITGTAEIANPAAAPRSWLAWLGWLVGVDTNALPDAERRSAIAESATLQRRGSSVAIIRAAQRTLTGSKSCRLFWNVGGADPYELTMVTLTAQTPDSQDTLDAAWAEKPAGVDLILQTVTGSLYIDLAGEYADYDAVAAGFTDYDDLADWVDPNP